jgi:Domain of unknown function (DUF4160)
MVTVHRAFGFRFVIFANDHSPPHVHVFGHGGEAKILLDAPEGVRLEWVAGIGRGGTRKIILEAEHERTQLIQMWRNIHD